MRSLLFLPLSFSLIAGPVFADLNAAGAAAKCKNVLELGTVSDTKGLIDAGWCAGFAQAVAIYELRRCAGPIPPAEALAQAFVNWTSANPQYWDIPPSEGMAAAFLVFPCEN